MGSVNQSIRLGKKFCSTCEKLDFYAQVYFKTITTTLQNKDHRFQQSFSIDLQASGFDWSTILPASSRRTPGELLQLDQMSRIGDHAKSAPLIERVRNQMAQHRDCRLGAAYIAWWKNKRKKITRVSEAQVNHSRMYMTQKCVHGVKGRTKRNIMTGGHDKHAKN